MQPDCGECRHANHRHPKTRTRGPFWSIRPARILLLAVLGTQVLATLIAVYGAFMAPIGWQWALFVWGYALAWFLLNDGIKRIAYRICDEQHPGCWRLRRPKTIQNSRYE
jgi:hypothetical protein